MKAIFFDQTKSIFTLSHSKPSVKKSEVLVQVHYSGINYKDALGVLNLAPIFKKDKIIPGIDASGTVVESQSSAMPVGTNVIINGMGAGEERDGGYAEYMSYPASKLIVLPEGLSLKEAMLIGTAGFTAALAIKRMIQNGQTPEMGPVLVTGSGGGVGGFGIQVLSQLGFEVYALTSRMEQEPRLLKLGARKVLDINKFNLSSRPLEKAEYGGAIDNLGGVYLKSILARVHQWGSVASIGLASGAALETSVMPFILRGVSLLGASSNNCPIELKREIWGLLASKWKPKFMDLLSSKEIKLEQVIQTSQQLIELKISGRCLVQIKTNSR